MEQHLQELLGNLRGRTPPSEAILQRLYDINPKFRITWEPGREKRVLFGLGKRPDPGHPAFWHVWELRPAITRGQKLRDTMRRKTGEHRLRRMLKWPTRLQELYTDRRFQGEAMMAGYWDTYQRYTEERFGTDQMFQELERFHRASVLQAEAVERGCELEAAEEMGEEMQVNTEFAQYVRDVATDWYNQVAGNPTDGWTPESEAAHGPQSPFRWIEREDDGAGRQPLDRPGDAPPAGVGTADSQP